MQPWVEMLGNLELLLLPPQWRQEIDGQESFFGIVDGMNCFPQKFGRTTTLTHL
jgi:hypothetical protein